MTKLVMNGLSLRPYKPLSYSSLSRLLVKKGDILKDYLILDLFHDQNNKIVYLVECTKCKEQTYKRFQHKNKVVGCRSCTMLKDVKLVRRKIGDKVGTYTITDIFRNEKGVPHYKIECECGYKGTRRNLTRAGKCQRCYSNNKVGKTFGKLLFTKYLGRQKFEALCDCGKKCIVHHSTKSCGCLILKGEIANGAKLTNKEAMALRELYATGVYTPKQLSEMFNYDYSCVYKILKNKRYKQ